MACTSHASSNAELAAKINSVLSTADETPPLQLWNTILDILKEYNVPYELEAVDPKMLLPHPKNRGGSMLHPFNSHKVGLKVKKAGADFKELTKARCWEVSPDPGIVKEQFAVNAHLAETCNRHFLKQ